MKALSKLFSTALTLIFIVPIFSITSYAACTHSYGTPTLVQSPTCINAGAYYKVCTLCSYKYYYGVAPLGHIAGVNGHCIRNGCSAIIRELRAGYYVTDTVSLDAERIYTFYPAFSGIYTICTTVANEDSDYIPSDDTTGDTITDTYIRVYTDSALTNEIKSNDDIAANGNDIAYNEKKLEKSWKNYNSSVTGYFSSSQKYYIKLTKGGTISNTIS